MFTITITAAQLDFMQAYLQNAKINTNDYQRSPEENEIFDAWLTSLESAVSVS